MLYNFSQTDVCAEKNSILVDILNKVRFDLAYFFPRLTGVQGILLGLLIGIE